jgi:hypothetical protein
MSSSVDVFLEDLDTDDVERDRLGVTLGSGEEAEPSGSSSRPLTAILSSRPLTAILSSRPLTAILSSRPLAAILSRVPRHQHRSRHLEAILLPR